MLVIVRPLGEDVDVKALGKMLSKASEGTDYFWLIIKDRIDFNVLSRDEVLHFKSVIDKYLERHPN